MVRALKEVASLQEFLVQQVHTAVENTGEAIAEAEAEEARITLTLTLGVIFNAWGV